MLNRLINKKKVKVHMGTKRYIADMETDGVYFSDEQKKILEQQREQLLCNYSGLPSLITYVKPDNI